MASVVKIKRSSVQGKSPTTGNLETGELALNLRDQKLFSSNGSVVFEIGANNTTSHIGTLTVGNTTPFTFPTTDGSDGQVLQTDGSGTVTWQSVSGGSGGTADFKEFSFVASEGQQSFSGTDRFNQSFSYSTKNISVFLNGILQVANTDYLASNTTSVYFTNPTANNDEITIQSFDSVSNFVDVNASITSNTETTSTATQTVVDTFDSSGFRTAKYIVQVNNRESVNEFQSSEVLLIHNGSTVFLTEYATLNTNGIIASIDADISGGSVRLLVTPSVANTEIKVLRTGVTV